MKVVAADIASVSDYTAAAVLAVSPDDPRRYWLASLSRWRDKYPVTVSRLVALARLHPDAVLVIDATGVGRPVLDSLRAALPARAVWGVTITGGKGVNRGQEANDLSVPKQDIVGAVQVLLQEKRLQWPREIPLLRELQGEFAKFRMQTTKALNPTFGAETGHDDLVLAVGLGCWLGEHLPKPLADVEGLVYGPFPDHPDQTPAATTPEAVARDFPHLFGDDPR